MKNRLFKFISSFLAVFLILVTFSCKVHTSEDIPNEETPTESSTPEEPSTPPPEEIYYNITFNSNNQAATGNTASIKAKANTTVTLTENGFTLDGYTFTGWNTKPDGTGTGYAESASLKLTGDITLYAQWVSQRIPLYNITILPIKFFVMNNNIIPQGSANLSQTTAETGKEITLTITPYEGYAIETVVIKGTNNEEISVTNTEEANSYKFIMPNQNVNISISFKFIAHSLQIIKSGKGDGNVISNQWCLLAGKEITITVKPDKYNFVESFTLLNQNNEVLATKDDLSNNSYTFIMPDCDLILQIKFSIITHTVTFVSNCSVEIPAQVVEHGQKITAPDIYTSECSNLLFWYYVDTRYSDDLPSNQFAVNLQNWPIDYDCTLYAKWETFNVTTQTLEEKLLSLKYDCTIKITGTFDTSNGENNTFRKIETILSNNSNGITLDISGVTNLENIDLHSSKINNLILPDYSFNGISLSGCTKLSNIEIPNNVSFIGDFTNCPGITSIIIPAGQETINDRAFMGCRNLTNIQLPDTITSMGSDVFKNCSKLQSIIIPACKTTISSTDFEGCSGLKNIIIQSSVTSIARGAFKDCSSLEEITIPFVGGSANPTEANETTLFGYIFGNNPACGNEIKQFYGLEYEWHEFLEKWLSRSDNQGAAYNIPNSLTKVTITGKKIPQGAFSNCKNITHLILTDNLESIGKFALWESGITHVTIPDSKWEAKLQWLPDIRLQKNQPQNNAQLLRETYTDGEYTKK